MNIYALSDPHLSGAHPKTMEIFGGHWQDHDKRICYNWQMQVDPEDYVLLPGDISWAMTLADAQVDLDMIGALPGRKVLLRGNHDYWWSSISQVRGALPSGMYALQNDCLLLGERVLCGTRGWTCPSSQEFSDQDRKIYLREVQRLELSLKEGARHGLPILVMLHYPPFNERQQPSGFTDLIEAYGVDTVIYGHLHGPSLKSAFEGELRGVRYHLVSCDYLDFSPKKLF